jgi:hypothetical protein
LPAAGARRRAWVRRRRDLVEIELAGPITALMTRGMRAASKVASRPRLEHYVVDIDGDAN